MRTGARANYLSVGQIYLLDNPLLTRPLTLEHVKPRLLGHWGTSPGLNFIYAHLNRVIGKFDLDMIYIAGPGHGGPALVANAYLEGTYSEYYPEVAEDVDGLTRLFRQFSFPGGIPSHVAPETPGSIHEGGELGYSLSHAYGAAFDNPDLIVACVIGDGEAETGPLATSWHSNKFVNPARDGAVLPILHLNGYKIAGPTVLARIPRTELTQLMAGYGYEPHFVDHTPDSPGIHRAMAETLDRMIARIRELQSHARAGGASERPRWPMLVLTTPKGWTGPDVVDGEPVEGTWRSHQVPLAKLAEKPEHLRQLEEWMKSYRPQELFTAEGRLRPELRTLAPAGRRRMSDNPHANGGTLLRDLRLPDFREYALAVERPGAIKGEATRVQGALMRDVMRLNAATGNFRIFSPDELTSNRWDAVLEVTSRMSSALILDTDSHVANDGRVLEMLSEHQCQGWLEGYLLTGRHGFFSCYEAFIHIVDSMFNQHAKWLKTCNQIAWRRPIASLNYLLTSHVWRQDHNGFSHQDPGFIDHVVNKTPEVIRVYLPPDANTLLSVTDHCLRSRNLVNVIVAGKQPQPQWLAMDEAIKHCSTGVGIWTWASNDAGRSTRCRHRLRRGRADPGGARRGAAAARMAARAQGAFRQRGRSHDAAAAARASARAHRRGVRRALHRRPPDHLRLPRLSLAHPPAHLSPQRPRQPARARLQGTGHDDYALRHDGAERPRPLPSRRSRARSHARAAREDLAPEAARARQAGRAREYITALRRGPPRDPGLVLAGPLLAQAARPGQAGARARGDTDREERPAAEHV